MAFENVKIVNPYVEKSVIPEIKLTIATAEEVAAVEAKLNLTFPKGYKEFVTTLGKGDYCGHNTTIRVDMPFEILSNHKKNQQFLDKYWFWEDGKALLSKETAVECIRICDTDVGDIVIFHPSNPNELFALPHEDDMSYKIGSNLYEAFDWLVAEGNKAAGGTEETLKRRMFVPGSALQYGNAVIRPEGFINIHPPNNQWTCGRSGDFVKIQYRTVSKRVFGNSLLSLKATDSIASGVNPTRCGNGCCVPERD